MQLQSLIHRFEVGTGSRFIRAGLGVLALLLLVVCYDWRAYRNMATQEAMDSAQLARNLAQGRGYTTSFIRPFSMFLLTQRNQARQKQLDLTKAPDLARIKGNHPDLANPPVYPVVLAGLMKVLPFNYAISSKSRPFWSQNGRFYRYEPDFLIALFNQLLLLAMVTLVFLLARRLFDLRVARLAAVILLGTEVLWRFSVSGLSTMLLLLVFTGLVWCLVLLEQEAREPKRGRNWLLLLAVFAGLLTGLGGLTRYSFAWLILPVLGFVLLCSGKDRVQAGVATVVAFLIVLTPWVARNVVLSGAPFGTATYAPVETTFAFPSYQLERSLQPALTGVPVVAFWYKLIPNLRQLVQNDIPRLGGTWLSAFFLVSILIGFRSPAVRRVRYFLLGCLAVLLVVQALGRTQLSEDSPEINSENLLILVVPWLIVYGVSLFYLLFEQMSLRYRELRYLVIGLFTIVACLPLLLIFLPPKASPIAYPPYYPPAIQTAAGYTKEDELSMSDVPWAMAWYGQSQCVWLTLNPRADFFSINDYQKPVQELFLAKVQFQPEALYQMRITGEQPWDSLPFEILAEMPALAREQGWKTWPKKVAFPIRLADGTMTTLPLPYWQYGFPDILLLTARPHYPQQD